MKCIIHWMVLQISIANSTHQGDRRNLFSLKGLDGFHWKKKTENAPGSNLSTVLNYLSHLFNPRRISYITKLVHHVVFQTVKAALLSQLTAMMMMCSSMDCLP